MALVDRQYVVQDDQGRYGIAHASARNEGDLWARPIEMQARMAAGSVPGTETLPGNAVIMTRTHWSWRPELDAWTGVWCDYNGPTFPSSVPPEMIRRLTIVDDLGWLMPDKWADSALSGSEDPSHWNYGAKLGKVGGEPPVRGQLNNEMTVQQAVEYAREVGEQVSDRGLRLACANGYITGARKVGRDWLMTYEGVNNYLDNRPRPGRK